MNILFRIVNYVRIECNQNTLIRYFDCTLSMFKEGLEMDRVEIINRKINKWGNMIVLSVALAAIFCECTYHFSSEEGLYYLFLGLAILSGLLLLISILKRMYWEDALVGKIRNLNWEKMLDNEKNRNRNY